MSAVLLATCAAVPDGDEDGDALLVALRDHGLTGSWRAWDDPKADFASALTVLRSTWDYAARAPEFLAWARSVPWLRNSVGVVEWNHDKRYLAELHAAGVPIVESSWIAPGQAAEIPSTTEVVIKPTVGAGSRGVGRFAAGESVVAGQHVAMLHAEGRTALVQPYLHGVDAHGETALIYIRGAFSHAIRKGAMLPEGAVHAVHDESLYVQERIAACVPTARERAVGDQVLVFVRNRFGGDLLYLRLDLLPGPDGPVVGELEITEPSLFLGYGDGAADRFATAIADEVAGA